MLGSVPEDTKVWRPGLAGWMSANRVGAIADEIPPEVPLSVTSLRSPADDDMPEFDGVPPMFRAALIADEDAVFRRYLAMPLAAQGFTIFEAGDGAAAWQIAVQHRPWIILADISMPELDGFEFCRRVRNHPLLARTPLLFISGSDKYRERHRALQIGADDFLSKTTPIRELLIRMQLLMTRYSDLGTPHRPDEERAASTVGALEGQVEVFGAPTLVQICNQGRLTGVLSVSGADGEPGAAVLGFRDGEIVSARVGNLTRTEAVYVFLAWPRGSFHFVPGDPGPSTPLAPTEQLLLEGSRQLEESRAAEASCPWRARASASSRTIGGNASKLNGFRPLLAGAGEEGGKKHQRGACRRRIIPLATAGRLSRPRSATAGRREGRRCHARGELPYVHRRVRCRRRCRSDSAPAARLRARL